MLSRCKMRPLDGHSLLPRGIVSTSLLSIVASMAQTSVLVLRGGVARIRKPVMKVPVIDAL